MTQITIASAVVKQTRTGSGSYLAVTAQNGALYSVWDAALWPSLMGVKSAEVAIEGNGRYKNIVGVVPAGQTQAPAVVQPPQTAEASPTDPELPGRLTQRSLEIMAQTALKAAVDSVAVPVALSPETGASNLAAYGVMVLSLADDYLAWLRDQIEGPSADVPC